MTDGVGVLLASVRRLDLARLDQLAAAGLVVAAELIAWLGHGVENGWVGALGLGVMTAPLAFRRRWPLGACAVAAVGVQLAQRPVSDPEAPVVILAFVLFAYGVGAFPSERRSRLGLLGLVGVASLQAIESSMVLANLFFDNLLVAVLPWVAGTLARERAARERASRERAERLDSEREEHALAAAWGERARIAREVHDVIAHSVSVMVIQAAAARTVMETEPARAEASLRSVERAGREALVEMRRLLGMLGEHAGGPALAPQPGLADLAALVARTCAAGLATTLRVEGEPAAVPLGLGLTAYRIVQEALTNTIKHAGPARATVCVRWRHDALELEIADDGQGPGGQADGGGGHGIAGMRERAALHGGRVETGPGAGGGFAVHARIPLVSSRVG